MSHAPWWVRWPSLLLHPFAVFALLLLGVNVWLVKQLLRVLKDNSQVIAGNTRAIESVANIAGDTKELMQEIRDELFKRPCLLALACWRAVSSTCSATAVINGDADAYGSSRPSK